MSFLGLLGFLGFSGPLGVFWGLRASGISGFGGLLVFWGVLVFLGACGFLVSRFLWRGIPGCSVVFLDFLVFSGLSWGFPGVYGFGGGFVLGVPCYGSGFGVPSRLGLCLCVGRGCGVTLGLVCCVGLI